MKLDRNTNRAGRGKYALVNMRKLIPMLSLVEDEGATLHGDEAATYNAFQLLLTRGIITLGNETPGDQFFVMKYKDQFTAPALQAYADSIRDYLRRSPINVEQQRIFSELNEYQWQMQAEADKAVELGNRIPD